jgi:spermidine synthase
VQAHLLTRGYLDYRLNARQLDWFLRSSLKATKSINHDLRPVAVYQSLLYWNKKFSVLLYKVLEAAQGLNLKNIFILIFLVTSIWLYYLRRRQNKNIAVSYSIATTGFFSMLSNLMLIFAYQVFCGYLYQRIGLLTSIFMAGIALGSIWITARLGRLKNPFDLFLKLELLIILFVGLLFLVINHFFASGQYIWYAFILLFFFCGLLTGLEFPLANKICLAGVHTVGKTVGSLYALDLLGGWLAGMVGGVILLPVLGFGGNCAVMAALKVSSFFGVSFSGLTSRSKLNKNRSDPVFKNLLTSAVS